MTSRSDTSNRGVGSTDKEKQREISAKGGRNDQESSSSSGRSSSGGTRGGSSEQHAKAGRQSHKNS